MKFLITDKDKNWSSGTVAPTTGTGVVGDICWNATPTTGGISYWECVTAGTPGTWIPKQIGVMSAITAVPSFVGQMAVVGGIGYMATGAASTADWKQITN